MEIRENYFWKSVEVAVLHDGWGDIESCYALEEPFPAIQQHPSKSKISPHGPNHCGPLGRHCINLPNTGNPLTITRSLFQKTNQLSRIYMYLKEKIFEVARYPPTPHARPPLQCVHRLQKIIFPDFPHIYSFNLILFYLTVC